MAFLERRRFTFFDLHKQVDSGKVAECLQDTNVTVATSGNGQVVLCDVTGWAHLVSRTWAITSFKAYELTITLAHQLQHEPYLVTVGDDEAGVNPLVKVWDWSRSDRHGNPTCVRVTRAVPSHMRPTAATALAVHDNKSLLAVGFQDGSVSVFRGDLSRQRSGKMRTLPDSGTSPITGLAFKGADKLFVVSRASVCVYWLNGERCATLDATGAPPGCSALADKHQLMVARPDAIYCYTTEGRGPCYALEGEKVSVNWFRSYLVITTVEVTPRNIASSSNTPTPKNHHVTILDIQNNFTVFSRTFGEIDAVLTEWGSFYILTRTKEMMFLEEKDLQSKLSLLFKKNLYDVAIRIASSQHYDAEGLTEIYKQYGDHLYAKGDFKGAIEQYVKTIGRLETSYVICKYLDSRHLEPLVRYLEELHKKGLATEDHTTLLLTCYVKIDQHDQQGKLKEFINAKNNTLDVDVDVAIKVVRQVSPDDALSLAANKKRHDWYLKITIEDKKDYQKALDYIAELEMDEADFYMRKYGDVLIQHLPAESTNFLKILCTDYRPRSAPLVDESALHGQRGAEQKASPDDYLHLFLSNSERLIEFLEHMISVDKDRSKLLYNALVEHYIHVWVKAQTESEKTDYEQKIMNVLKNSEANYDKDQTLIICQMLGFKAGMLYLYEENKLWRAQVALHMRAGAAERALGVCRRRGAACPRLWLDVLWWPPPAHCLPELLNVVANEKLLSPTLVIDCLTKTPSYSLGDVRKYLLNVLKAEDEVITRERVLADKYRAESSRARAHIERVRTEPVTFQNSRCHACGRELELPTVHFLCQHSYHQDCFQSYSESESECPECARAGAGGAGGAGHAATRPPAAAEALHARLQKEHDPYAVVSEYFGRGLFNKLTVVTGAEAPPAVHPAPPAPAPAPAPAAAPAPTYGAGAEARARLEEGQTNVYASNTPNQRVPRGTGVVPVPEGRMRQQEAQHYSTSLEANMKAPAPVQSRHQEALVRSSPVVTKKSFGIRRQDTSLPSSGNPSPKTHDISSAISNSGGANPFEEIYDDTKNPFAEEACGGAGPSNPFEDDDDYDKNLNPFA